MGMTMSQKILARHSARAEVKAGELGSVSLDLVLGSDVTTPIALMELRKNNLSKPFDPGKIVLVMDHFTPNKDIQAARNCAMVRAFAQTHNIPHFYDVGRVGVEHALLPEKGLVAPGELVIGADSHTCTYGALGAFSTGVGSTDMAYGLVTGTAWMKVPSAIGVILKGKPGKNIGGKDVILTLIGQIGVDGANYQSIEFMGEGISSLSIDDRLSICNMAIEAGAKNGIFPVDGLTLDYLKGRVNRPFQGAEADSDAEYERLIEIDLSGLEPVIAFPHLPSNVRPVREALGIKIDQVIIGSCSNGFLTDLRKAAGIMKDKKVAKGVRCLVIPATQQIYLDAIREGLIETFVKSGAAVSAPSCGPCNGGHLGVLADGERCVATTNRNFIGRMGATSSEIYLAGPIVAAAAALAGEVALPN
jgi:3-isopropylmalate/(R)-2-methylmalate dehydratase large subunit